MNKTRLHGLTAVLLIASLFVFQPLISQDTGLAGTWKGAITLPNQELKIMLEFTQDGDEWQGNVDIPLQKAKDMPLSEIKVDGAQVAWKMPDAPGAPTFAGTISDDDTEIKGDFTQLGQTFPFAVKRESAAEKEAETERIAAAVERFRGIADSLRERRNVPGYGISIVYQGEVVLNEGFGYRDLENKIPVDKATNFAIGSSSKAFTALSLGTLVEEGKLAWNEPVRTYLPDFKLHDDFATEQMTTLDLLSHRSGLPRHDLIWYGTDATRKDLYARLQYLEPNKPFRANWQYQNLMYMTAGYLGGQLYGSTWEDLVRDRIFKPLEMKRSNFALAGLKAEENTSLGYQWDFEAEQLVPMDYRDLTAIGPAGSINSNADEMSHWLMLNLKGGKYKDEQVVDAATLNLLHQPQMVMPGGGNKFVSPLSYGLGWMLYQYKGKSVVEHGGNIDGFSAAVWVMPDDDFGMVVLSNGNTTPVPTLLCRYATDLFLDLEPTNWDKRAFGEEQPEDEAKKEEKKKKDSEAQPIKGTKPSHPLADYAGTYHDPGYGDLEITYDKKAKALTMHYNSFVLTMQHWHYDVFVVDFKAGTGGQWKMTFNGNAAGQIDRVSMPLEQFVDDIVFHKKPPQTLEDPEFLARLVGNYKEHDLTIKIFLEGEDQLVLQPEGQPKYLLVPWRENEFRTEGLNGYSVEFVEDKDGNFNEIILHQPNGDFPVPRAE
ncbi:MAG: serine hydrolase [Bacteroidota bacterium]